MKLKLQRIPTPKTMWSSVDSSSPRVRRTDQAAAQIADALPVRAVVARYIGRDAVVALVDADADFVDAGAPRRELQLAAQLDVDFPEEIGLGLVFAL
jgi:hypothetical protein